MQQSGIASNDTVIDEGKNQGYNENHLCNISNFFTNSSSGRGKKIITN